MVSVGISCGFLWKWEVKFYSHANPADHVYHVCLLPKVIKTTYIELSFGIVELY